MLTKLVLDDIGPFRHWEADFRSPLQMIVGDHARGKTTVARVFSCMLSDHDTSLIRQGCDQGTIYMEFLVNWDPATGEVTPEGSELGVIKAWQHVRSGGSKYDIELPNGLRVLKSHKTFLRSLGTGISIDPLRFMHGTDAERLDYLLSVHPIEASREEVKAIVDGFLPVQDHYTLPQLEQLMATVEKHRSDQNAAVEATKGLLRKLEENLRPVPEGAVDWVAKEAALRSEIEQAAGEAYAVRTEIGDGINQAVATLREQSMAAMDKLKDEETLEIERVRARFRDLREREERTYQEKLAQVRELAEEERRARLEPLEARKLRRAVELSGVTEKAREALRDQAARENVEKARANYKAEVREATKRQQMLEALRLLRKRKLSDLGIAGLEIREGVLFVDGKQYKTQLNETEQKKVAIQVAAEAYHRNRQRQALAIMFVEAGDMTPAAIDWVMQGAEVENIQVIMTKTVAGQEELLAVPYEEWRTSEAMRETYA